ncbi:ATP-binding protein [Burkholderia arboris]|uniref:AAA family ATPase n=1 Tax=Burkholderia arboris TaxID=488730 RepID=UPI001CA460C9|nr:ATP-binding protein [Burkholderia arboris]MBY8609474.1 ATP-binding protein [Burkholderia arboris]
MLAKFSVKNFKNFGETFVFDLTNTSGYEFNKQCIKNGIVRKAVIYGHNGVGKSNLGFALFDLISHLTDRHNGGPAYENYLHAGTACEHASFEYNFIFPDGSVYYEYGKANQETLIYERLVINGKEVASLDRRKGSIASIKMAGAETLNTEIGESKISIISYIKNNSVLENNKDNSCFNQFLSFVGGMLFFRSLDKNQYVGFEQGSNGIEADIISKSNVSDFQKFLNDAGIECKIKVVEAEKPYLAMEFGGRSVSFQSAASQGTKSLELFYYWYQRLRGEDSKVTFLFVDEFDAFYHHELSELIIRLLREINAQAIITTHNTSVMTNELLRPDCYFIMHKNRIRSLVDQTDKDLREAHNIEKMYRAGAFGG